MRGLIGSAADIQHHLPVQACLRPGIGLAECYRGGEFCARCRDRLLRRLAGRGFPPQVGQGSRQPSVGPLSPPCLGAQPALQVGNQAVQRCAVPGDRFRRLAMRRARDCRSAAIWASRLVTASCSAACCLAGFASSAAFSASTWHSRLRSARLADPTRWESMCTSPNASRITACVAAGWVSVAQ